MSNIPRSLALPRGRVVISVVVVALVISLGLVSAFLVARDNTSSTSCSGDACGGDGNSSLNYRYAVDMFAVDSYGNWVAGNETPSSILQIVHNLRSAVAEKPINVFGLVKNIQNNTELLDNTNLTLDNFLLEVKQSAGGDVVPELNLDTYTNPQGRYCDPEDPGFCGPGFFYKTSLELLSLKAVQEGNGTVLLDSWPTFYRSVSVAAQLGVLQNLTEEGWHDIIIKQIGPAFYPSPGYTWGQITTPWKNVTSSPPYMQPQVDLLDQMPPSQQHFLYFDRQNKNDPNAETALQVFLSEFDSTQQASVLTNFADLQSFYGYTFDYPVLTFTTYEGVTYSWDASTNLQNNGQPFLQLIEHLMNVTSP